MIYVQSVSLFGFNNWFNSGEWTNMHRLDKFNSIVRLILLFDTEMVFWSVSFKQFIVIPSNFLRWSHWVRIFLFWNWCQNLEFLFQNVCIFWFHFFHILVQFICVCHLICNYDQMLWIEIKCFIKDSTSALFFYSFFPLSVDFNLVHVLSWTSWFTFVCHFDC